MFDFIKNFFKILKGEKILMIHDSKDFEPIDVTKLNDFDLINKYQTSSFNNSIYLQEFINRKIGSEFKIKARDINDELFEFKKDLDYFMQTQANKEKYDNANNLKLQKNKVDMLIRDINNNRQYIVRVK